MLYFSYKIRKGLNLMSKKIYINWERNEYYTTEDEVREAFENDDYVAYPDFEEFLNDRYTMEEVFDFDEDDRRKAKEDFEEEVQVVLKDWIETNLTVINVDILFKGK